MTRHLYPQAKYLAQLEPQEMPMHKSLTPKHLSPMQRKSHLVVWQHHNNQPAVYKHHNNHPSKFIFSQSYFPASSQPHHMFLLSTITPAPNTIPETFPNQPAEEANMISKHSRTPSSIHQPNHL